MADRGPLHLEMRSGYEAERSGSIWGGAAWGAFWIWDARITSTALLFLVQLGYLAVRHLPSDRSLLWNDPELGAPDFGDPQGGNPDACGSRAGACRRLCLSAGAAGFPVAVARAREGHGIVEIAGIAASSDGSESPQARMTCARSRYSWLTSIPRNASISSTIRRLNGKRK